MTLRALILPATVVLALGAPAAAQQAPDPDEAPARGDADRPAPRDPQAPTLFGGGPDDFGGEEFRWVNPESDRWPNDLDPRGNEYLPRPRPAMTFELDLDL